MVVTINNHNEYINSIEESFRLIRDYINPDLADFMESDFMGYMADYDYFAKRSDQLEEIEYIKDHVLHGDIESIEEIKKGLSVESFELTNILEKLSDIVGSDDINTIIDYVKGEEGGNDKH